MHTQFIKDAAALVCATNVLAQRAVERLNNNPVLIDDFATYSNLDSSLVIAYLHQQTSLQDSYYISNMLCNYELDMRINEHKHAANHQ